MNETTDQPEKFDLYSMDISGDKRAEILRLFPEARTENDKIDFDRLKLALGGAIDFARERYGLSWPGKAECFKTIQAPSLGTLRPAPEESVNWDTTENLIIEGDNLEVLKLLQKAYLGRIKMIYIDPPYNTGNDFIYPDNYAESLQTYLQYTGQVDAEGRKFGTNTEAEGRYHSNWLNMMYPRLYLARNLLREDGILFVSIDDHELINCQKLCQDVFGEESVVGNIVWKRRQVSDNRNMNNFSTDHEYVVVVMQSRAAFQGAEKDKTKYSNPDNDARGPWMSDNLTGLANAAERPNLHYDLVDPKTENRYPPLSSRGWAYEPSRMDQLIAEGRILWPTKLDGRPRLKRFLNEIQSQYTGFSSLQQPGFTTAGTRELEELFGEKILAFPKPTNLISLLASQVLLAEDDIILDFFAGSGTTAHATLELNRVNGGNSRFILVQLPEPTERADYPTIADITKERVRRVIKKLNAEDAQLLNLTDTSKQDRGFRVFKLAESNFKSWSVEGTTDADRLVQQLDLHIDHVKQGRTDQDILFELLLKSGFPLTVPIERLTLAEKYVFSIGGGLFLVCLDRDLSLGVIRAMSDMKPARIVCLDEGFRGNDQLKTNAVQIFKAKGVGKFLTV
jgi:adenine-specific DNA-methyltransferase